MYMLKTCETFTKSQTESLTWVKALVCTDFIVKFLGKVKNVYEVCYGVDQTVNTNLQH